MRPFTPHPHCASHLMW